MYVLSEFFVVSKLLVGVCAVLFPDIVYMILCYVVQYVSSGSKDTDKKNMFPGTQVGLGQQWSPQKVFFSFNIYIYRSFTQ